jgi:hypothetical protein
MPVFVSFVGAARRLGKWGQRQLEIQTDMLSDLNVLFFFFEKTTAGRPAGRSGVARRGC